VVEKTTEAERAEKDKKKTTRYFWYNGSTSDQGGEEVEETEVKAKGEKPEKEPVIMKE